MSVGICGNIVARGLTHKTSEPIYNTLLNHGFIDNKMTKDKFKKHLMGFYEKSIDTRTSFTLGGIGVKLYYRKEPDKLREENERLKNELNKGKNNNFTPCNKKRF